MNHYRFKQLVWTSIAVIGITSSIDSAIISSAYSMDATEPAQHNETAISLKSMFQELINNMDKTTEDHYSYLERRLTMHGMDSFLACFYLVPELGSKDKRNSIAQTMVEQLTGNLLQFPQT